MLKTKEKNPEQHRDLLYLCNPTANKNCRKTICFWNAWKRVHDNDYERMCYKTCHEEFAARDADGKPIVWPEGEETVRKSEALSETKICHA